MHHDIVELLKQLLPAGIGIVGVLSGVFLTSKLTENRQHRERVDAFRDRQLTSFYSPAIGVISEAYNVFVSWELLRDTGHLTSTGLIRPQNVQARSLEEYADKLDAKLWEASSLIHANFAVVDPTTRELGQELGKNFEIIAVQDKMGGSKSDLDRYDHVKPILKPLLDNIILKHDEIRDLATHNLLRISKGR